MAGARIMRMTRRTASSSDESGAAELAKKGTQMSDEESAVLGRVAAGEPTAVKECMDRFGGLVWTLARRALPTAQDAEDATQEIFTEIWLSADRYDENRGSETVFVATIARRRLIDRLRKQGRQPFTESADNEALQLEGNVTQSAEVCAEASLAARAVARLNPAQQRVLELGLLKGLSHSEIAEHTGMPLGTVKTQMRRGLIKVRELMEVGGDEDQQT
jgi:RNA polymerase sigma-70 factor (ECF subfamily)